MVSVADSPKIGAQKYNYAHNPSGSAHAEPPPFTQGRQEFNLCPALSFPLCSSLPSGAPFGADAPLPLEGAALRGKDLGLAHSNAPHLLAPLLGKLADVSPTEGAPGLGKCH